MHAYMHTFTRVPVCAHVCMHACCLTHTQKDNISGDLVTANEFSLQSLPSDSSNYATEYVD